MERAFFETKVLADESGAISGLAWKFGAPDRIGDWIEPGAFKGLKLPLPMLFGHDLNDPVGAWDRVEEKADGLHVAGRLLVDEVAARSRGARAGEGRRGARPVHRLRHPQGGQPAAAAGGPSRRLSFSRVSLVSAPMHPGAKVTSAKSAAGAFALAESIRRAEAAIRGS